MLGALNVLKEPWELLRTRYTKRKPLKTKFDPRSHTKLHERYGPNFIDTWFDFVDRLFAAALGARAEGAWVGDSAMLWPVIA